MYLDEISLSTTAEKNSYYIKNKFVKKYGILITSFDHIFFYTSRFFTSASEIVYLDEISLSTTAEKISYYIKKKFVRKYDIIIGFE